MYNQLSKIRTAGRKARFLRRHPEAILGWTGWMRAVRIMAVEELNSTDAGQAQT